MERCMGLLKSHRKEDLTVLDCKLQVNAQIRLLPQEWLLVHLLP